MELNELRRIAKQATPGPWRIDKDSEQDYEQGIPYSDWPQTLVGPKNTQASQWTIDHGGEFMVDEINELSWPDAEFIATFDPPSVLALLSRLEQAEQAVARVRELHERIPVVVNGRWEIDHCKFCYEQDFSSDDAVWPCPTIRALDGDARRCIECNGTGDVQVRFNHGIQTQDCAVCFGTGDGRG